MKVTVLLSGQGETPAPDAITMWRFDEAARAVWEQATEAVGEPLDSWLEAGAPSDTRRAQLISAVGSLATFAVAEREFGLTPSYVIGHSVGEVAAVGIAMRLAPATVARIVDARARAMLAAIQAGPPMGMRAVFNPPDDLADQLQAHPDVYLANLNSATQAVISGTLAGLDAAAAALGLSAVPLQVTGAFHTPLMAQAARDFEAEISDIVTSTKTYGPTVVSNRTATAYRLDDVVAELAAAVVAPVRWRDCVRYAYEHGSQIFLDLSSTGMLTRMADPDHGRFLPSGTPTAMDTVTRELRHLIAVERDYDLAALGLGVIVSTRNEQPDPQAYREQVVPAYQQLRAMVGQADQQPQRVLDIVERVLTAKSVDPAIRERRLAGLRWRAARLAHA